MCHVLLRSNAAETIDGNINLVGAMREARLAFERIMK
jgi:hypothetical protein